MTNPWQFAFNYFKWQQIVNTCYGAFCGVQNNCFGYDCPLAVQDNQGCPSVAATDSLDQACFRHDMCYNCAAGIQTDTTCPASGYTQQTAGSAQQCDCDLVNGAGASSTCTDDSGLGRAYCDLFALQVQAYFGTLIQYRKLTNEAGDCNPPPPPPSPSTSPGSASSGGDVHFHTLDQCYYTFMGVGDYLLYSDPQSFTAHIRMLPIPDLFPGATITTGLCMQQGAPLATSPRVCVYANASFPLIRVDGVLTFVSTTAGASWCLPSFCVTRTASTVTVAFLSGYVMAIQASLAETLWSWTLTVPPAAFNSSSGLLGRWDNSLEDDLVPGTAPPQPGFPALSAPLTCDGGSPSGSSNELYAFGYSYQVQVSDNSSLFDYPYVIAAGAAAVSIPATIDALPAFASPSAETAALAACAYLNGTQFQFDCQYDAALLSFSPASNSSLAAFNAVLQAVVNSDLTQQQSALLAYWSVPTPSITFTLESTAPTLPDAGAASTSITSLYSALVTLSPPSEDTTAALIAGTQLQANQTAVLFDVDLYSSLTGNYSTAVSSFSDSSFVVGELSGASSLSIRVRVRLLSTDPTVTNGTLFTSMYTTVGLTVPGCQPVCTQSAVPCGSDGCGRACGECADGTYCNNANVCQSKPLVQLSSLLGSSSSSSSSSSLPSPSSSSSSSAPPASVSTSAASSSTVSVLSSSGQSSSGGGSGASMLGDPQIVGLLGQSFQVHGIDGQVYNLICDRDGVLLNARFVFLRSGSCPRANSSNCWSHPGSYIAELGARSAAGEWLTMLSGPAKVGFRAVTVGNVSLAVGERYKSDALLVEVDSAWSVRLRLGNFELVVENSDHFLNLVDVRVLDWQRLASHGLLGQTWHAARSQGRDTKHVEGAVDDYAEAANELLGDDFVFHADDEQPDQAE